MERRQYNRINALLEAEERVLIENGTELVPGTLINLSAGGILLTATESGVQFQAGGNFHLFLDNGGHLLELNATAVRADGQKIAFRFYDLGVEQKRAIQTKMIRLAIILSRIRGTDGGKGNGHSDKSDIFNSDNEILVSENL